MNLNEFFNYKNTLMKDLLTTDDIVTLIAAENISDPGELAYKQIFPYEFVPDTVEAADTYICYDVDVSKSMDSLYYLPTISIWVFTHKSLMRLPEGGVRVDCLCSKICEKLNGSLWYGLGELELYSVKRFAPMTDYQGKCMVFHTKEFSRFSDPQKTIPSNRRAGV